MPFRELLSAHACREARREGIRLIEMEATYLDPDAVRRSTHDEEREIRTRWFGEEAVEVVVDRIDGRVVTTWRRRPNR
jgi:hypothetical protein